MVNVNYGPSSKVRFTLSRQAWYFSLKVHSVVASGNFIVAVIQIFVVTFPESLEDPFSTSNSITRGRH